MTIAKGRVNRTDRPRPRAWTLGMWEGRRLEPEKIGALLVALEVPFEPGSIRWRVTDTIKNGNRLLGRVMPYADQRAYLDRLNRLVGPNGWTRKYGIHTSANFARGKEQKISVKIIVSCEVAIFGVGAHSATGEEWADSDNAATSSEAQAFKRACTCFGLGRYLYYFRGTWVDLGERKQPRSLPALPEWATPDGWSKGLRPWPDGISGSPDAKDGANGGTPQRAVNGAFREVVPIVRKIESMQERLGKRVYRGMLKNLARVWNPTEIHDLATQKRVLKHMQAAERGFKRVEHLVSKLGRGPLLAVLTSLSVSSLEQVADLDTLKAIVLALEAKTHSVEK